MGSSVYARLMHSRSAACLHDILCFCEAMTFPPGGGGDSEDWTVRGGSGRMGFKGAEPKKR